MTRTYYFARIRAGSENQNIHYSGLPRELGGQPVPMPDADFCLLAVGPKDSFLFRYTRDGEFAGDTWHPNEAEAKEQAEFEYGANVGEWVAIPDSLITSPQESDNDNVAFNYALAHLNGPQATAN